MPTPLRQILTALTQALAKDQRLWRPSPFIEPKPAWLDQRPALASACLALNDSELDRLENDPQALLQKLSFFIPEVTALAELTRIPRLENAVVELPKRWDVGMPGRKAEQVRAFAAAVVPHGESWLDWCSGKAHLGRTLGAVWQMPCVALELDYALCREGARSARPMPVPTQFINTDVLRPGIKIPSTAHLVALHACGDLHRGLVLAACEHRVGAATFAPCCYALWVEREFTPLSQCARKHDLHLTRDDLRLAVQESVTAAPRIKAQSHKLTAWRLGFDTLQRRLRQSDTYWHTPSLPLSALHLGFEQCCRQMAEHTQLFLPASIDWNYFEKQGYARWAQVRRLQLVRHLYRRALEFWLVLDAALCLEEAGFTVKIGEFCARTLTPRNLLIDARA